MYNSFDKRYRLQINGIEKHARQFWDNLDGAIDENTQSYIRYMQTDCSEMHENICDALIVANLWADSCNISKNDFSFLEVDSDNNVVQTHSYQATWDSLDKMKVYYKSESAGIKRNNIYRYHEAITAYETGEVVCRTNFMNVTFMMHIDLLDSYMNDTYTEFVFDCPVYILQKANNQPAGVFNRYFVEE